MRKRSLVITALMAMCLIFISAPVLAAQIYLEGTIRDFTPETNSDFEAPYVGGVFFLVALYFVYRSFYKMRIIK